MRRRDDLTHKEGRNDRYEDAEKEGMAATLEIWRREERPLGRRGGAGGSKTQDHRCYYTTTVFHLTIEAPDPSWLSQILGLVENEIGRS